MIRQLRNLWFTLRDGFYPGQRVIVNLYGGVQTEEMTFVGRAWGHYWEDGSPCRFCIVRNDDGYEIHKAPWSVWVAE